MKHQWLAALLCCSLSVGLAACGTPSSSDTESIPMSATDEIVKDPNIPITPVNLQPQNSNVYPFIGMTLNLPKALHDAIHNNAVFMTSNEEAEYADLNGKQEDINWNKIDATSTLHKGCFDWRYVPKAIRDKTPTTESTTPLIGEDYDNWLADTQPLARLMVYNKATFNESMLDDKNFDHHEKLGSNDKYVFILHTNEAPTKIESEAAPLFATLAPLKDSISINKPQMLNSDFTGYLMPIAPKHTNIGKFKTQTLDGKPIDSSLLAQKKLTMVNVWTTWCTACIEELPALEKLSNEFKNTDLQIMSIVGDTYTKKGGLSKEQIALAKEIQKKSGLTFPSIVPDDILHDGILGGLTAYPITYFVDQAGNIVGDPVTGAHSEEDWRTIMKERLAEVVS